jgi:hypothetical protein
MIFKNYNIFVNQMLLESVLEVDGEFRKLLYSIYNRYSDTVEGQLAYQLLNLIDYKQDIKTNYNGLGLTDKNSEISFIPDRQFQTAKSKGENPWTKTKSKAVVGRLFRQILHDNKITFTDSDLEKLVNLFKTAWDRMHGLTKKIEIVNGEKILYWYNSNNYFDKESGTLGNSCMRGPSKNHFMKIYAENPNRVSLVIVTDENKLIARSLLWKLDKSTSGKKYFLDRIYTRYDSDQKLVMDWALENVAKGDESIISFYHKSNYDDMYCNLNHVEFEYYPYADTMHFLYKKLINNQLSQTGLISNTNDSKLYKEYIVFDMQDTNGELSLISHSFSHALETYIPRNESVYVENKGDYFYKKDCKQCNRLGTWYLESDVVYSQEFDDWFPKDRVINHPKYGLLMNDMLVDVITEYLGDKVDPIDIAEELTSENILENFKLDKFLKSDDETWFRCRYSSNYDYKNFDEKLSVFDYDGRAVPNFLCYKVYGTGLKEGDIPNIDMISPKIEVSNIIYTTEIDSQFLNIKIDKNKSEWVYYNKALENKNCYSVYQSKKDEFQVRDDFRKKYENHINSVHNWLMRHDSDYRESIVILNIFNKLKINIKEFIVDSAKKCVEKLGSNQDLLEEGGLEKCIKDRFKTDFSEKQINEILQLIVIFFSYYIICNDSSEANYYLKDYLSSEEPEFMKDKNSLFFNSLRNLFYHDLRYILNDEFTNILEKISDRTNFSSHDIRRYIMNRLTVDSLEQYFKLDI